MPVLLREMEEPGAKLRDVELHLLGVPSVEMGQLTEHVFFLVTPIEGEDGTVDVLFLGVTTFGLLVSDEILDCLPLGLPYLINILIKWRYVVTFLSST